MTEPLSMGRGVVFLGWRRGRGLVKGDLLYGEGWKGRAGDGIGMVGYGHWLVRVPPELVLGVVVRGPPLLMEGVWLLRVPPDPTWEVWLTAQQALPFLSSLTTYTSFSPAPKE